VDPYDFGTKHEMTPNGINGNNTKTIKLNA